MAPDFVKDNAPNPGFDTNIYKSLIGSLLYLSQWMGPDITVATNWLSRTSNPIQRHWQAAKRCSDI